MNFLRLAEKIFTIAAILFYSDAIFSLLKQGQNWVSPVEKFLYYLIPCLTCLLLIVRWRSIVPILVKEKWLWILICIALMSFFWSADPGATFKADIALMRLVLFGIYFATRYSLKEQIGVLVWSFGIAAFLSLCFGLFIPKYGVMGMGLNMDAENKAHIGSWRGIFSHKNGLGRYMTLSTLVFLLFSGTGSLSKKLKWVGFSLSLLLILLSNSKSSAVILVTLMALVPFFRAFRWKYSMSIPFVIFVLLATGSTISLFLDNAELVLGAMGKDLTLTGRSDLWSEVLFSISERPWLGYGYDGFWHGIYGASEIILKELKWAVPHAHNGYLDIALDLGLCGLLIFSIGFLNVYLRSIERIYKSSTSEEIYPIIFLTFLFMSNLTESSFFKQGFIVILYTSITLLRHRKIDNSKHSSPDDRYKFLIPNKQMIH
jgi:exopolysaccharide production protein ExoQ